MWHTDLGTAVDITSTIPYVVKHMVYETVERRLWYSSALAIDDEVHLDSSTANEENDIPFWYPLRSVVLGTDKKIGGAARSVAANTQWCQARLAATN